MKTMILQKVYTYLSQYCKNYDNKFPASIKRIFNLPWKHNPKRDEGK
jgi:hypothetical protein